MRILVSFLVLTSWAFAAGEPLPARARVRPAEWAAPVIDASLENCFRVSDELFRCEQPAKRDLADLQSLGIRTLLNLRRYHTDSPDFAKVGFTLAAEQMDAGKVSVDQLVAALRKFRTAPKPVLVHCWHGSDRTGTFIATYRLVFQNWTRAAAIDELRHGGYGFHDSAFPNLVTLLETMDIEAVRRRVME